MWVPSPLSPSSLSRGPGGSSPLASPFPWAADQIAHPRGFEPQLQPETSLSSCRFRLPVPSYGLHLPHTRPQANAHCSSPAQAGQLPAWQRSKASCILS